MDIETIEGALTTLHRVTPSDELLRIFQRPRLCSMMGFEKKPDLEFLDMLIDEDLLEIWEVIPQGSSKAIAYACYVANEGPPFVCMYTLSEQEEIEIAADVLLQLTHTFFRVTEEEALYFYRDKPVEETIHNLLTEGGFDLFEDCPTVDNEKEACYVLWRYTYDAYYGEGSDEDSSY